MISDAIGAACKRIIDAIVRTLARSRINPNALTFIGLLMNIGCGVLYGYGRFFSAGLLMILANLCDMLDGQVARLRGRATRFGAFFDSVIDRYSDVIVFVGNDHHWHMKAAINGIEQVWREQAPRDEV